MINILSILSFAFANPDYTASNSIIVEAHRDLEIYVAPIVVRNFTSTIEADFSDYVVFGYTSSHSHNAQIENERGAYEPLLLNYEKFKVYNEDTIKYSWEDCDYVKDAKACTYKNNHYLLETFVTVDDNELVVAIYLLDSELQIISQGIVTDKKIVRWIRQQEKMINNSYSNSPQQVQRNCSGSSCTQVPSTLVRRNQSVVKKKEELPLRWEIPHRLLDKHFHQDILRGYKNGF